MGLLYQRDWPRVIPILELNRVLLYEAKSVRLCAVLVTLKSAVYMFSVCIEVILSHVSGSCMGGMEVGTIGHIGPLKLQ